MKQTERSRVWLIYFDTNSLWKLNKKNGEMWVYPQSGCAGNGAWGGVGTEEGAGEAGHQPCGVGGEVNIVRQELASALHAATRDLVNTPRKIWAVDCVSDVPHCVHHGLVHLHLSGDKFSSLGAKCGEQSNCELDNVMWCL